MLIMALFTIAKAWTQAKCLGEDIENTTHTQNGLFFSL